MSKLRKALIGIKARKERITLAPMPDNMLKNNNPDWMYAAQDLYELSDEEDLYYHPWNEKLLNNRKR
tara:strand:+ start:3287 stop:3487 length:201 start_codon:yes stop_codon:yes gene_type:complete